MEENQTSESAKLCPLMKKPFKGRFISGKCVKGSCAWWVGTPLNPMSEGHCVMQALPRLALWTEHLSDSLEVIKSVTYQNSGL